MRLPAFIIAFMGLGLLISGKSPGEDVTRKAASALNVSGFPVASGGGRLTGGAFEIQGAFGQAAPQGLSGGAFALVGGLPRPSPGGGGSGVGDLFADGFESGDLSRWSQSVGVK